jgi:PIN domain nuclease of toxin-antitoxin system
MKLLLDTHLLLWTLVRTDLLSASARLLVESADSEIYFSAASIWEIAIKHSRGRPDFQTEPGEFRQDVLRAGYIELPVFGPHAVAVAGLPPIHKDPFDRLLIAQSQVEGIILLTADPVIARYPGPIRLV